MDPAGIFQVIQDGRPPTRLTKKKTKYPEQQPTQALHSPVQGSRSQAAAGCAVDPRSIPSRSSLEASSQGSPGETHRPRDRPNTNLEPPVKKERSKSTITDQTNTKCTEVEVRVERQRGWDHTAQGAHLNAAPGHPP